MKNHLESSIARLSGSFTSFLLLFALASLVMAVALACGRGSPSDNPLELILDNVRGVVVVDFEQIRAGGAPDQAADSLESAWNTELAPLGIIVEEITMGVLSANKEDDLLILGGNFDFGKIRNGLKDHDYKDREYWGQELWEAEGDPLEMQEGDTEAEAVALLEERASLFLGSSDDVKDILWALEHSSGLLLDDEKDVIVQVLKGAGSSWLTVAYHKCPVPDVRGCRGAGLFFGSGDGSEVDGRFVFMFRDEDAADSALDTIDEGVEDEMSVETELKGVSLDGEIVTVRLSMDEKVFITELMGLPLKDSDAAAR